jgi:hypothetical protein
VVTHDLIEDPPLGPLARVIDLVVAVLGVGVSWLGIERNADPATWQFARHLVALTERSSLVILIGFAIAALSLRVLNGASKFARAASPAGALGPESVLLGIASFGFTSTALRLVLTVLAVGFLGAASERDLDTDERLPRGWLGRVSEALERSGPWLVLGLVVGALLSSVPPSELARSVSGSLLELVAIALVANVTPVAAPAALLIATGLGALGLSSGAALLFASLAPLLAGRSLKPRQRLAVTLVCCVVAGLSDHLGVASASLDGSLGAGHPLACALAALLLFGVWQRGARIWLSSIVRTPAHEHEHAHDVHGPHGHGHGHDH